MNILRSDRDIPSIVPFSTTIWGEILICLENFLTFIENAIFTIIYYVQSLAWDTFKSRERR